MTRRPAAAARSHAVELEVRLKNDESALWQTTPPAEGWTPAAVLAAAVDFATDTAPSVDQIRFIAKAAHAAFVYRVASPSLRHEILVERLRGIDRFEERFGRHRDFPGTDPTSRGSSAGVPGAVELVEEPAF